MALSVTYERTYDDLLTLLGSKCDVLPKDVYLHWPLHQPSYTGRLLVIGQALNGWMVDCPTYTLADALSGAGR